MQWRRWRMWRRWRQEAVEAVEVVRRTVRVWLDIPLHLPFASVCSRAPIAAKPTGVMAMPPMRSPEAASKPHETSTRSVANCLGGGTHQVSVAWTKIDQCGRGAARARAPSCMKGAARAICSTGPRGADIAVLALILEARVG